MLKRLEVLACIIVAGVLIHTLIVQLAQIECTRIISAGQVGMVAIGGPTINVHTSSSQTFEQKGPDAAPALTSLAGGGFALKRARK
jgi:hypothetical protein